MRFSGENIAAMAVCAALVIIISAGAIILFKLKKKDTWLPAALIGAGTFVVFAMVLERLLHTVMIPLVYGNAPLYIAYGALAAGVFEETGRYIAYKVFMKNHRKTTDAVMMGLGHGCTEALLLVGISMLSDLAIAVSVNLVGEDAFLAQTLTDPAALETARAQLAAIASITFPLAMLSVLERVIAITFHVCMSVLVSKAAFAKGKVWLFPAAVLFHAALDTPAMMYQTGILPIWAVYIFMAVLLAAAVFAAVKASKLKTAPKT